MNDRGMRRRRFLAGAAAGVGGLAAGAARADCGGSFSAEPIFPPEPIHNHASCLVELPDGSLLVAWYRGTGERSADDVVILGSRLVPGRPLWERPFVVADTPGYPDCNPALFVAPGGAVWLFWPTILDHRWEGALLKFRRAPAAGTSGAPPWEGPAGVLHVTPAGFKEAMDEALKSLGGQVLAIAESIFGKYRDRAGDELYQRLGWMPRVRPTLLPSGRWLLPLYSDTFSCSLMALSDDQGNSWTFSRPLIGFGNIQPSVVARRDGTLVAFMRENGPRKRIRMSTSSDEGITWSPVEDSPLPNPGAGIEAVRLASGRWALIHNDTTDGRHSLAVAVSEDEGRTWPIVRHVERSGPGTGSYHYPSILQARDGSIHASYTWRQGEVSTIQHARFDEEWLLSGKDEG